MLDVNVSDIVQLVWANGLDFKAVLHVLHVMYVLVIKLLQVVLIC